MSASSIRRVLIWTLLLAGVVRADDLAARFAQAPPEFSPVPIWWWSGDKLERDRLVSQLERLAQGGIHNAIILNLAPSGPLYGSAADDPPFLSEPWWDLFKIVIETGKRVGVRIWFYDQLGFSGSGLQARVVREHPEFRGIQLGREVRDVTGPAAVEIKAPPGAEAIGAFIARPSADENKDTSLGVRIEQVRDLREQIVDNALKLQVPDGRYRVQLFYTTVGGFDYQNPGAGRALIDVVHGEMERRFKNELGKAIAGSFQDEFPPMPRVSKLFWPEFKRRRNYELLQRLPALYDDVIDRFGDPNGPTTTMIRCDANRVAGELCEEAFFKPLFEWHEQYGMLCGYDQTIRSGDPVASEWYYVDYWRTMNYYGAPGNEHGGDSKPHQSIAELYGRPRVWFEAFHSSGWGQTLEEIGTLLHPWFCDGSTLYNPHAIYYSTHGSYWEWAPPDTGWRQPYFVHYPQLAQYVSRLSYVLSQGRHINQVALLYPAKTVHAFAGFNEAMPPARRANDVYWAIQRSLRDERLDYLIIDEESVQRGKVEDGLLKVNQSAFKLIFLPAAQVIGGKTLERLTRFAEAGGIIVIVDSPPRLLAHTGMTEEVFAGLSARLQKAALKLDDPKQAAGIVLDKLGRDLAEKLPALHRRIGDRDFYFVLSDDGTPIGWQAQYDINHRKLYETPAATGTRLDVSLKVDGTPELWDATTGQVLPVLNYQRADGRTRAQVELTGSPAPLLAVRPAKPDEPTAIESDLQVVSVDGPKDGGDEIKIVGLPRWDATQPAPTQHEVKVQFAAGSYAGSQAAKAPVEISVNGPWGCELLPTCDNGEGSFAWPPSPGPIPIETRVFKYREEAEGQDAGAWKRADLDDSGWDTVLASYGPHAEWTGPITLAAGQSLETLNGLPADVGGWKPAEYSLKLGINEDPIYKRALGGKGRIPEEFIEIGDAKAGDVYLLRTWVSQPEADRGEQPLKAVLRVGGEARKRVWLNGREVQFEIDNAARILRAPVTLMPGSNRLEIAAARVGPGNLRLFYQLMPADDSLPDPQWIWTPTASPTGQVRFKRSIDIPGPVKHATVVLALGDLHKLRVNGKLVADQGNFDPYFTSRSEQYDVTKLFKVGANVLEIEAREAGSPTGLILDGRIELADGKEVWFVSDQNCTALPLGVDNAKPEPAKILANPAQGYLGETATLLLRPRPHPLPQAGWLIDQPPPPAPFNRLVFAASKEQPRPAWYRFRLPPGAKALYFSSLGKAELFVNGQPIAMTSEGDALRADLPNPQAETRIAALRIQPIIGCVRGAALSGPITYDVGPGAIPLGCWGDLGLPHYSGGMRYSTALKLPKPGQAKVLLDLGRVRGSVDVTLNGKPCGTRIWHPYRFDLSTAAQEGVNKLEIRVFNTMGPHFGVGHPSNHVFDANQLVSGLFGPVRVRLNEPVEMTLPRVK